MASSFGSSFEFMASEFFQLAYMMRLKYRLGKEVVNTNPEENGIKKTNRKKGEREKVVTLHIPLLFIVHLQGQDSWAPNTIISSIYFRLSFPFIF